MQQKNIFFWGIFAAQSLWAESEQKETWLVTINFQQERIFCVKKALLEFVPKCCEKEILLEITANLAKQWKNLKNFWPVVFFDKNKNLKIKLDKLLVDLEVQVSEVEFEAAKLINLARNSRHKNLNLNFFYEQPKDGIKILPNRFEAHADFIVDKAAEVVVTKALEITVDKVSDKLFSDKKSSPWASKAEHLKRWDYLKLEITPSCDDWLKETKYWKKAYKKMLELNPLKLKLIENDLLKQNELAKAKQTELKTKLEICQSIQNFENQLKPELKAQELELLEKINLLREIWQKASRLAQETKAKQE